MAMALFRPATLARSRALCSMAVNPMFSLEGKTALVTGGARDIGQGCAIELARAGADVCINYYASATDAEVVPSNNTHAQHTFSQAHPNLLVKH